jgi:chemotaxis protein CheX
MDVALNEALIKATKETFKAVIGLGIQNSQPVEKKINGHQVDTSVIISFVGSVSGAFTMRCSKELGASLASIMLGIDIDANSDDMKDAVGELFNMIVGACKSHYASSTDPFKISVPTTVVGGDYTVHIKASSDATVALIPFSCDGEDLSIEVFLN